MPSLPGREGARDRGGHVRGDANPHRPRLGASRGKELTGSALDYSLIQSTDELQRAAANALGAVGIDTEFIRERTYRPRLCLVQMAIASEVWIIDPEVVPDVSLIGLLIGDPEVEIIVHAGRQDFELFFQRYGATPKNIFDVQIAAGFCGYGSNLPYGRLVETVLGVELVKGESYTDWCKRPLTAAQMSYAADDVRYLVPVADALKRKLESLGRDEWVREEMTLLEDPELYDADPATAYLRVAGRGQLRPRQLAVLKEVAAWREEAASRRDLPRGWVVKDPTLVEIARRSPSTIAALKSLRGLNPKEAQRSGDEILRAVEAGDRAEPPAQSRQPSRTVLARARMMSGLADALVRARCERAEIATDLVATRTELERVLVDAIEGRADPSWHRLLRGWRASLAGDAVVELAQGRIGLRAVPNPPYVEEVML